MGRAIPGYYPAAKPSRQPVTAGNGPRLAGVGWKQAGRPQGNGEAAGTVLVPPFGPGRSGTRPSPPCTRTLRIAASQPIRARLRSLFYKVSQNRQVSPKMSEKACHSPYLQNGSQKSPLEIPGFWFSSAFSHKELMVLFCRGVDICCQNDEVSTRCAHRCHAK